MPEAIPRWFVDELVALYMAFPSSGAMPTHAPPVWWRQFSGYDETLVRKAFWRAPREAEDPRFMPSLEAIRRLVEAESVGLAGHMSAAGRALKAWDALSAAISSHGTYASVDFDDPVINATVRNLGGWMRLGKLDRDEFDVWVKKEFERVYCELASAGVSADAAKHLPGIHEQSNSAMWLEAPVPKRIDTGLPPHSRKVVFGETSDAAQLSDGEPPLAVKRLLAVVVGGLK